MEAFVKVISAVMLATVLLSFASLLPALAVGSPEQGPVVVVDPAVTAFAGPIGSTFSVNVTVANVTELTGVQFHLTWDPQLLSCQGIREVLFHTVTPASHWNNILNVKLARNNNGGYADYAQIWLDLEGAVADGYAPINVTPANYPPEGKITLATFTMRVEKTPDFHSSLSCNLSLSNVIAADINSQSIPLATMNGTFTLNWSPPVTTPFFSVIPSTYTATRLGEAFNISVLVNRLDAGWQATDFEFKLGYNASLLNVQQVYEGSWLPLFGIAPNGGTFFSTLQGVGLIQVGDFVQPDGNGTLHAPFPSGAGTLAIIQFNGTMQGNFPLELSCPLYVYDTIIRDWNQNGNRGGPVPGRSVFSFLVEPCRSRC